MTIFLTTQYLEEADELAEKVGIINDGRLIAEGTPEELKRSVGNDVIIANIDGEFEDSRRAVLSVSGVRNLEVRGEQLVISADDGAAVVGPVAVCLDGVTRSSPDLANADH